MKKIRNIENRLLQPVKSFIRSDFAVFKESETVESAFKNIREKGLGERIIYFYVSDEKGVLKGVIPTRKLLLSSPETLLSEIMNKKVFSLPENSTLYEAVEFFILYRYLALPVTDSQHRIIGIVDINLFTDEIVNYGESENPSDIFEYIGFKFSQIKNANPFKVFSYRFPWLLATVTGGLICAVLVNLFETTLEQGIVLAFFLALVLSLAESLSIQTMTITIQTLKVFNPDFIWYFKSLAKEFIVSSLIGLGMGILVSIIVVLVFSESLIALILGISIAASNITACIVGLTVPFFLHYMRLDPKIAAGPATLAVTDVMTLLIYFNVAAYFL